LLEGLSLPDSGFEDWRLVERTRLHDLAVDVLSKLVVSQAGAPAIQTAQRLLQLEPTREETHRTLMRLYSAAGDRSRALRQYQICRDHLRGELAVLPSQETEVFYRQIRDKSEPKPADAIEPPRSSPVMPAAMQPETRYAHSGDVNIAYQVLGSGPLDLVFVMGWVSNVELAWEEPAFARFLMRLASFSRLILFDKRGTGLSDRATDMPSLETRIDDVRAVMDVVGSERAALFGISEGGPLCMLFAASHPTRTSAVIMAGSYPKRTWAPDYPWGPTDEELEVWIDQIQHEWGGPAGVDVRAPSMAHDERFRQWWARFLRMSASPTAVTTLARMNGQIDVRHILPAIRAPTLILHAVGDRAIDIGGSRYMAERISAATFVELPGADHLPWLSDADVILEEVEEFLTGVRPSFESDRVLATVLFTNIVGATEKAVELGDRRWHDLLDSHNALVRRELARFRGREVDTVGDGFLATFDGPARAVRCARAISEGVRVLGLEIRAGLHTGECEVMGDDVGGIAVHTAARVAALAGPGEVLVSSTVKDLVAGSGLNFRECGARTLTGIPGEWRLFAVER
jgi:pimeloyl-ACP methyl ester carboxylesterase